MSFLLVDARLHEAPLHFLRRKLVRGCMYVQSAIPKTCDNVSDMVLHREYFTTVRLVVVLLKKKKKTQVLVAVCHRSMNVWNIWYENVFIWWQDLNNQGVIAASLGENPVHFFPQICFSGTLIVSLSSFSS